MYGIDRARITFVVIPFSSVKQTAAGQKQVKSSGYGHGQANRRDLEDAKSGLSRHARHVIDKTLCRRADQCSATGDRKTVVKGKCVSGRVDLGGRRILKKKKKK